MTNTFYKYKNIHLLKITNSTLKVYSKMYLQIHSKQECKNSKLYITTKKYIHVPYLKYSQLCHIIKSYITMLLLQLFSLIPCNTCPVQCKMVLLLLWWAGPTRERGGLVAERRGGTREARWARSPRPRPVFPFTESC